jgi:flagellar hook-basal body complex protein FliE
MSIPFSAASNAYANTTNLVGQAAKSTPQLPKETTGADFGQMVTEAVGNVVETGRQADQKAMDLVDGKANVVDVVTAISETEIAMETMVTIRDRVITAYEEIMRMPI